MNRKLGPGTLLLLGLILLYLSSLFGSGFIAAGVAVGGLACIISSIIEGFKTIVRRSNSKKKTSVSSANDFDELVQNWTKAIVKAPLLVWTQSDLISQNSNPTRTSKEIYATAGMVYLAEHMISQNIKDKVKVEGFANKLLNHAADEFAELMLSDDATRADKAEFSNMVKKAYFYFWTTKEASENSPKGSTDIIIDKLHSLDKTISKNELEGKLRDYLVGQRFVDFANIATHIINNLNIDKNR